MNQMEDQFEQDLSRSLRRVDAPLLLAEMIASRAAAEPRRTLSFPQRSSWLSRLAALFLVTALLFGVGFGALKHHRAQQRAQQRARAEQDFATSLAITNRALEPVRRHLQQAGINLDE